jgi:DNA-binding CsgD family transcriptional regulator
MLVFGTEMHIVTFIFVLLEILMFFYQFIYFLSRPQDKNRMWYLILLSLLIVYNITGGLFPDPNINIPIVTQNIIAYGSGFLMGAYFPYYFYKGFDLEKLRLHAVYGVLLFLILPYLVFFVIVYSINKNLDFAIKNGIVVPFFYSIVLLWAILRAIRLKYKQNSNEANFKEVVAVYCAVIPWATLTAFAYFHVGQLIEVLFTNFGFLVITIIFILQSITRARFEYDELESFKSNGSTLLNFEPNYKRYQLTTREIQIVQSIQQGLQYKSIGQSLFISEKTVNKHVRNIYAKVRVSNKVALLNKLHQ